MVKKYVIFAPYFGGFPNNFRLWLESCKNNDAFQFIVFTDNNNNYTLPDNVKMVKCSFSEFKKTIQSRFDFEIALSTPYKLCDFKSFYGYIFEDYIKDYEYWGYCDLDLEFGDLMKFLPKDHFDKLSHLGHFCLYPNNEKINKFFLLPTKSKITYKDVLSNNEHFGFDEIGEYGVNSIFEFNGLKILSFEETCADVSCKYPGLQVADHKDGRRKIDHHKRIFRIKDGEVWGISLEKNELVMKEYSYVHHQKRMMNDYVIDANDYYLLHDRYKNIDIVDIPFIKSQPLFQFYAKGLSCRFDAIKNRIKRNRAIRRIKTSEPRQ